MSRLYFEDIGKLWRVLRKERHDHICIEKGLSGCTTELLNIVGELNEQFQCVGEGGHQDVVD